VRRLAVPLAAVAAAVLAASTAIAAGPTGDPAAIALYRQAVRATNALPAYVQSQAGYVRIQDSLGPMRFAHWAWGWDQFQPGYFPATERLVLVQRHGVTEWLDDTLTASTKGCQSPSCREAVPIELVITRTQVFAGLISSGSTAPCFVREPMHDAPYTAGSPWWTTTGQFAKARPDGPLTEITSRFSAGDQVVTESDWIATSTHLFAKSALHFAATHGHRAYTFSNTDRRLDRAPKLPSLTLCPRST
jgi:hypothetical protein